MRGVADGAAIVGLASPDQFHEALPVQAAYSIAVKKELKRTR